MGTNGFHLRAPPNPVSVPTQLPSLSKRVLRDFAVTAGGNKPDWRLLYLAEPPRLGYIFKHVSTLANTLSTLLFHSLVSFSSVFSERTDTISPAALRSEVASEFLAVPVVWVYRVEVLSMDKKTQKRVGILRQRIQKLQKVLACVKSQADEPDEIEKVEKELGDARLELETLLQS